MKAKPGDHIVIAAPVVDRPVRDGEVLEVRGVDGGPPYLVRWNDGHEGLLYPGPGSVLRVAQADEAGAAGGTSTTGEEAPTTVNGGRRTRQWNIRVTIAGSDDDSEAQVVLVADSPRQLQASGHAHRSTGDRSVPEIGDEVAVARALRRLADQLLDTAAGDIEQATGEHDVHLRAR